MFRRFAPSSSHRSCLIAGRLSACLGSRLSPLRPRHRRSCLAACRPIASRFSPRLIDTPGGAIRMALRRFSWLCLLAHRLAIPSVRFGIGWRRGSELAARLIISSVRSGVGRPREWDRARLMVIIGAACYLSDFLIVSSSHRLIASLRLPSPIARHGGRGGVLLVSVACLCGSGIVDVRFRLRAICAGSVEDGVGGCLACLAVVLCILSMGDGISATVRVRPLIAWTRPLTRFLLRPSLRRISDPGFFFFILSLPG